jgi:lipopolysaccharide biosynthesis glycosyltransferase
MTEAGEMHVCCAADAAYARHTGAMLHSVLAHSGGLRVHVHYLHGPGFPSRDAVLLSQLVRGEGGTIDFHEIPDERVAGLPTVAGITAPMWYRIFLPELLPDTERVLYLDADTIALDDLGLLWETDLDGAWVGAVTNVFQLDHLHRPWELGIDPRAYFNSGVLLMNLEQMRRDGRGEALLSHARTLGADTMWPDQDTLNAVLGERRVALHPRWNAMNSVLGFPWAAYVFSPAELDAARERPGIRHFEGPSANKPWHVLGTGPGGAESARPRRAPPGPRARPEGLSVGNALRRLWRSARWRLGRR